MPEHNLIQRPEILLRLQQFLGIRQAHIVPTLSEHVQPVVIIGDVREAVDERQFVRPCYGFSEATPVIGQFAQGRIRNPAASGVLIRIEELRAWNITAVAGSIVYLELGVFPDGLTAGLADFRNTLLLPPPGVPASNTPAGVVSFDSVLGVAGSNTFATGNSIGDTIVYQQPIYLGPGWSLTVTAGAATNRWMFGFSWQEENLERRVT